MTAAHPRLNRLARHVALASVGLGLPGMVLAAEEPVFQFTVSPRDTLIGLSQSTFVSRQAWREVARLNRLPDPNRITPGQVLRVPVRLMRSTPVVARITSVVGEVKVGDANVQAGAELAQGQSLQTGDGGSAVLELADGSRVRVTPSSLAELQASQQVGASPTTNGGFAGLMRLVRGSVEVLASKVRRAKPLEVTTPTAVVGVRGTHYRVNLDGEAGPGTRSEVLEGLVRLDPADGRAGTDLRAGFGAAVGDAGAAPTAVALQAAPDLSALPELFERPLVRFPLVGETATVRVQVAQDAEFDKVVSDQRVPAGTELRIAGLDDARWYLRARRLDGQGIEGFDSVRPFVLKARPEPPASSSPRANGKQAVGEVAFAWAPNIEAATARLQVASDAAFTQLLVDRTGLAGATQTERIDAPGLYFWRLASTRANGDAGPYGDPQKFELRPLPDAPKGGVAEDGRLLLAWGGRAEDKQQVELARDSAFKDVVASAELASPEWALPPPGRSGTYYFRYRSVEPDGFVTPYSSTLKIEVPPNWRLLWMLTPLLLLL